MTHSSLDILKFLMFLPSYLLIEFKPSYKHLPHNFLYLLDILTLLFSQIFPILILRHVITSLLVSSRVVCDACEVAKPEEEDHEETWFY